jgi:hypothetical protein
VTRVPGASRGGYARIRQERAHSPSLDRSDPCNCLVHASGTHRAKAGACSARLAGSPHGNVWRGQRNWHRLVPASSGAKASLACEGRQLDRVCPRVDIGCRSRRTTPRSRETRSRWQTGVRTGTRLTASSARGKPGDQRRRRPAPRWPSRGAGRGPSRAFERTLRGRGFRQMEGTPGCNLGRLVHASRFGATSAALEMIRERANDHGIAGEATGVSEARYARITAGRQRPPR